MATKERIIVALDVDSLDKASDLVEKLHPYVGFFKVGLELISAVGGPQIVKRVHEAGGKIFYDAKFNDIPNTVGSASRVTSALGVAMFDIHASCGREAIQAAAANKGKSKLLVVTVLTSIDEARARHIFGAGAKEKVIQFAKDAALGGADGIVCSPQELSLFGRESELDRLWKVVPGIRPLWASANDQKRVMTPAEALDAGATHLVIGRPITNPPPNIGSSVDAAKTILEEIGDCA